MLYQGSTKVIPDCSPKESQHYSFTIRYKLSLNAYVMNAFSWSFRIGCHEKLKLLFKM